MKKITLSSSEAQAYFGKYTEYARKAANSKDSEYDLKAAYYAPILLLQGPKDFHRFEEIMDKVLFHLDCAYTNAADDDVKTRVELSAQMLLDFHIALIELKLREASSRHGWEFFTTMLASVASMVAKLYAGKQADLSDDISRLFSACVTFFILTKLSKDDRERFYDQLIQVYRKVLNSPFYSKHHNLVKNSFIRVGSNEILSRCLRKDGFASTEGLLRKFGFRPDETGIFLRQIFKDLQTNHKTQINIAHEDIVEIRSRVRTNKLPNQYELDEEIFRLYRTKNIPRSLQLQGLRPTLFHIREFANTDHEIHDLLICLAQNMTSKNRLSDFIEIMDFSRQTGAPFLMNNIREELIKVYDQQFKPSVINQTKYKALVLLFAPMLCLTLTAIMWNRESFSQAQQNVVIGFFDALWNTLTVVTPYVLGVTFLIFGLIVLRGFFINSLSLRKHKNNIMELQQLLGSTI